MIRAAKIDINQPEIVQFLRAHGAFVRSVAQLKNAFDLLVFYKGNIFMVEVKQQKGKLTDGELKFKAEAEKVGCKYWIIRSCDDALEMLQSCNLQNS